MTCPSCGFENRAGAKHCAQCGYRLAAPVAAGPAGSATVMAAPVCTNCGAPNTSGSRFCETCGWAFDQPAAPARPPSPQPQLAPAAAPPAQSWPAASAGPAVMTPPVQAAPVAAPVAPTVAAQPYRQPVAAAVSGVRQSYLGYLIAVLVGVLISIIDTQRENFLLGVNDQGFADVGPFDDLQAKIVETLYKEPLGTGPLSFEALHPISLFLLLYIAVCVGAYYAFTYFRATR